MTYFHCNTHSLLRSKGAQSVVLRGFMHGPMISFMAIRSGSSDQDSVTSNINDRCTHDQRNLALII